MQALLRKARQLRNFARLVKDPNNTSLIFKMIDEALRDPDQMTSDLVMNTALGHEEFARLSEEGYLPTPPRLVDLERLPDGSFGRAVWAHMTTNGLDFGIWPQENATRPIERLNQRLYQEHDLWHALLGYTTSVEDELALQAFGAAQYSSPIGALLTSAGLLHLLIGRDPMRAVTALGKVADGYKRGQKAKFILGFRLHDMLALPLVEVRERVGVT